ncbi:MAG: acetyl-CoA C-acyltransferase [Myxococcota bacterium]
MAVWLCNPLRTPIGKLGGALSAVRPDDLLAHALGAVVTQAGLDPAALDEVIAGCANQAGEDNRNVARMALLIAGFPDALPAHTVNRLCASGLTAIHTAARTILAGDADLVLAGGVESMSRAPYSLPKNVSGKPMSGNITAYDTALGWRYPNPRLEARFPLEAMGETAENLAERHGLSREDQDRFALASHQKAVAAAAAGAFDAEITPVAIPGRKGESTVVAKDEGPRADTTLEALAKLGPAFRKGGTVTAGNSSTLNDGAAALLVASDAAVKRHGLQPMARLVAMAEAGVDPRVMGIGPVPATLKALGRAGWSAADLELIELNEAFAAQSLAVVRELGLDPERVNVHGGAIALGHPLGMSGARIIATLCHALRRHGKKRGLATLCVGVGQGVATLVEAP